MQNKSHTIQWLRISGRNPVSLALALGLVWIAVALSSSQARDLEINNLPKIASSAGRVGAGRRIEAKRVAHRATRLVSIRTQRRRRTATRPSLATSTMDILFSSAFPIPVSAAAAAKASAAPAGELHVCPSGCAYSSVQAAVDAANPGDTIKVAAGTYTGAQGRPAPPGYNGPSVVTQAVYISKTVTIQGGYTTAFSDPPDPEANPTTLNAQGQGRVLFVGVPALGAGIPAPGAGISLTIEGLRITGGDATGLGGGYFGDPFSDAGGGVYVAYAKITLSHTWVFSNTAGDDGRFSGSKNALRGLANPHLGPGRQLHIGRNPGLAELMGLRQGVPITLNGNSISEQAAAGRQPPVTGGGAYLFFSTATLIGNTIVSNTARYSGGLDLYCSHATLSGNTISSNSSEGVGLLTSTAIIRGNTISANVNAGVALSSSSDATLINNTISANTGSGLYLFSSSNATLYGNTISANSGSGLYLFYSDATLYGNTIVSNTASSGGGLYLEGNWSAEERNRVTLIGNILSNNTAYYDGGGLYLVGSDATVRDNLISNNTTRESGGGVYLSGSDATLSGNTVASNTAYYDDGGGLYLGRSDATLINNIVTDNQAGGAGSGLYIAGSSSRLLHTTIARNGLTVSTAALTAGEGDGSGVYVAEGYWHSTVAMTNTILVSHTVGITVAPGNTVTLEATLWGSGAWANGVDWGGEGAIVIGTRNIWGDPAFVDSASGDYHIGGASAARNTGIDTGVEQDIDGQPRPMDWEYDIGADEYVSIGLEVIKQPSATFVNRGQVLTYTILVTNVGTMDVTGAVLTGTLDSWQRLIAVAPSGGGCSVAGGGWGGRAVCTPGMLTANTTWLITLTAQVSTSVGLGQAMTDTFIVTTDEARGTTYVTTYAQDCHARLNDNAREYISVQAAVDVASSGDLIKVAGYCLGAAPPALWASPPQARGTEGGLLRQQVYLDKSLTIRGGYTTTNWVASNPEANPTTLDALGQGRVLYIVPPASGVPASDAGSIRPTIEGLRITGGDATGLGDDARGGGIYIAAVPADVQDNQIFGNIAAAGGGVYLSGRDATLSGNTIVSNTANGTEWDEGGGGLYLAWSEAKIRGNTIVSNTAISGGGLYLFISPAILDGNTIANNTAGYGGGLFLVNSLAEVRDNVITSNMAISGSGGGLSMGGSPAMLDGNTIANNTAGERGGGLHLNYDSGATLINNVIANNQAGGAGSGLYIAGSSSRLLHTTITRNTANGEGYGSGLYVTNDWSDYSAVALTNTVLVNHTVGISVTGGNTVTLNSVLWDSTPVTVLQLPTASVVVQGEYWGDPAFVNPSAGDYHIGPTSAAIDAGVDSGVADDIDGELRPSGGGYDLGADELQLPMAAGVYLFPSNQVGSGMPGATVTYTLRLVNQTGATDSFNLAVQPGNTWATTLSLAQTGPLPHGAGLSFTVWVEIPPSASLGNVDSVTIQATSVVLPGVYFDGATISTTAEDVTPPANPTHLTSPSHAVGTWSNDNTVDVVWSGAADTGSGVDGYSVLWDSAPTTLPDAVKDLEENVQSVTSEPLADGKWYFHLRTVDKAGNWAVTAIHLGPFKINTTHWIEGQVTNTRGEPVFGATVAAQPPTLNTARSDGSGRYVLYLESGGTYMLTVSREGFGQLPPRYGVSVTTNLSGVNFVLPPLDEGLTNGGWETCNLSGWQAGPGVRPTVEITTAAHTGHCGVRLQASGGTAGFWPYITQAVSVLGTWSRPTLSFMYRVAQGSPDDALLVEVLSESEVMTQSLGLAPGEWTHAWYDLGTFSLKAAGSGQTVTLRFGFQDQTGNQRVYLDEISLGEARVGVFLVYLPLVLR